MKTPFCYTLLVLCIAAYTQTACFTPSFTGQPKVPTVNGVVGDNGYYFTADDKATIISEGVPAFMFILKPQGWWMSAKDEPKAAAICAAHRNPDVWPAPATPAKKAGL